MSKMFKIYESGVEFLDDNKEILQSYPLETVFFKVNADNLQDMSKGFAVKAYNASGDMMIGIRFMDFPLVIFGDESMNNEFAEELVKNGLHFGRVLGNDTAAENFLKCYENIAGGTHRTALSMDIMKCSEVNETDISDVEKARSSDIHEIAELLREFYSEAVHTDKDIKDAVKKAESGIDQYYVVRRSGRIVSIAQKQRETEYLCSISGVFTVKEFRGKGLARQVVTHITKDITCSGKTAYLFVDKTNPVSNHLYQSIGYDYAAPQTEYVYIP